MGLFQGKTKGVFMNKYDSVNSKIEEAFDRTKSDVMEEITEGNVQAIEIRIRITPGNIVVNRTTERNSAWMLS